MKNSFLASGIVLALIFAGCTSLVSEGTPGGKDCGTDFSCFLSEMGNGCAPAKVSVQENGVSATLSIKGPGEGENCNVLIKMTDIQKTPEMTESVWKAVEASKAGLPLLDMTCPISMEKAGGLYQSKQILAAKEVFEKCTGSLKDIALLVVKQSGVEEGAGAFSAGISVFPPEIKSGEKAGIVAKGAGGKEPYTYDFEFGDGKSSMNTPQGTQEHQYVNEGNAQKEFTVKVTARDSDGAQAKAEAKVKVNQAEVQPEQEEPGPAQLQPGCTETDGSEGEKKYGVRGIYRAVLANGSNVSGVDECTDPYMIREYYCLDGKLENHNPYCNAVLPGTHCNYGACVKDEEKCIDGETGRNVYKQGSLTISHANGNVQAVEDTCKSQNTLAERSCAGTSYEEYSIECPQGSSCSDGACKFPGNYAGPKASCTDTEAGKSPEISGSVTSISEGGEYMGKQDDFCISSLVLREYYCDGGKVASQEIPCSAGKACLNGKCT